MKVTGKVRNGVIVLDKGRKLPEGRKVRVELVPEGKLPTLYERLKDFIGSVEGLPSDMAENHDYYLYGVPKKKKRRK